MKYNYEYISQKIHPIDDNQWDDNWVIDESDYLNTNECGGEVIEIDFRAQSLIRAAELEKERRQIIRESMSRHPSNYRPE